MPAQHFMNDTRSLILKINAYRHLPNLHLMILRRRITNPIIARTMNMTVTENGSPLRGLPVPSVLHHLHGRNGPRGRLEPQVPIAVHGMIPPIKMTTGRNGLRLHGGLVTIVPRLCSLKSGRGRFAP